MKRVASGVLALVLAVLGAVLWVTPIYADEGDENDDALTNLQISPAAVGVMLDPGDVLVGESERCPTDIAGGCVVKITNDGATALTYRLYVAPYSVQGEDNNLDFSSNAITTRTQIARWMTVQNADGEYVSEARYTIQPGESQTIGYRIDVPEDIPAGSQYAVIFAQILGGTDDGSSVETVGQVGSVISGRSTSGDTHEAAEISEVEFTRFAFSGPLTAKATIKNTGNTDFAAHYTYTAKTFFGKELYTREELIPAYPEAEYHVDVTWEDVPFVGIFQVEFSILAAGETWTETHVVVIMPVIIMILVILLLTVIVAWIIIITRKRKERKTRKLV